MTEGTSMMSTYMKLREKLLVMEDMLPIISASTIGSTIQWFDFYLYGVFSVTVFPAIFFPKLNPSVGMIASFGASFGGFVARPLGAVFFGWFGDRIGRRSTLVATLLLIGITTLFTGILPGYATLGPAAPILLTLLRFAQGIGVGGEWGGSTLLAMENSDDHHRAFWTSWPQAGVPIGLVLAALTEMLCQNLYPGKAFEYIGWRIPFLLSPLMLVVGFYIRLRIPETPLFAQIQTAKEESSAPLLDTLRYYWRDVLLSTLLRSGDQAPFYIFTLFLLSYGIDTLHLSSTVLYTGIALAATLEVGVLPLLGKISDHIGHKCCYLIGCIVMALAAFPYFWLLNTRNIGLIWLAIILSFVICHALLYAPEAALIAERFGTRIRYTGASLGFQLSSITAGGPAPLIAAYLLANKAPLLTNTPSYALIALFMIIMSFISLAVVLPLKDYTGQPLTK
jgi:MFS family permease